MRFDEERVNNVLTQVMPRAIDSMLRRGIDPRDGTHVLVVVMPGSGAYFGGHPTDARVICLTVAESVETLRHTDDFRSMSEAEFVETIASIKHDALIPVFVCTSDGGTDSVFLTGVDGPARELVLN